MSNEPVAYRHKKRGTIYEVIGHAELQASYPQYEKADLVIYRGEDGKLWARNSGEFHDGRFEPVARPPAADPVEHDYFSHGLPYLLTTYEKWLEDGPSAQPRMPNGIRPFSTGDLMYFIEVLRHANAAIAALRPTPLDAGFQWIDGEPPHEEGKRILVENDRGIFLVYWEGEPGYDWCWICPDGKHDDRPLRGNDIIRWAEIPAALTSKGGDNAG